MEGEIVPTPGHSDDSICLILGEGMAFTGELLGPNWGADSIHQVEQSWQRIRALNVGAIYPGHGAGDNWVFLLLLFKVLSTYLKYYIKSICFKGLVTIVEYAVIYYPNSQVADLFATVIRKRFRLTYYQGFLE
jgi:glyoxylase-like metal-dependent hydrolase (beta-lactamase superfamily II)